MEGVGIAATGVDVGAMSAWAGGRAAAAATVRPLPGGKGRVRGGSGVGGWG